MDAQYLPPLRVILVTDLQNVSLLKPEPKRLASNVVVRLRRVVEVSSHIFLDNEGKGGREGGRE